MSDISRLLHNLRLGFYRSDARFNYVRRVRSDRGMHDWIRVSPHEATHLRVMFRYPTEEITRDRSRTTLLDRIQPINGYFNGGGYAFGRIENNKYRYSSSSIENYQNISKPPNGTPVTISIYVWVVQRDASCAVFQFAVGWTVALQRAANDNSPQTGCGLGVAA